MRQPPATANRLPDPCARLALLGAVAAAFAAGCGPRPVEPPPARPPAVELRVRHFAGSPLTGPTPAADAAGPRALQVEARIVALAGEPPALLLDPIEAVAQAVVRPGAAAGEPLLGTPRLTRGARSALLGRPEALLASVAAGRLGPSQAVGEARGAVLRGATAAFEVGRGLERRAYLEPAGDRVAFLVHWRDGPAGGDAVVALEVDRPGGPAGERGEELAVLYEAPTAAPIAVAVALPWAAARRPDLTLLAVLTVAPPPAPVLTRADEDDGDGGAPAGREDPHAVALRQALADIRQEAREAARRAAPPPPLEDVALELGPLVAALQDPERRRQALARAAGRTGARLTEDLALSAPDATIERVARTAAPLLEALDVLDDPAEARVGWALERASLRALLVPLAREELTPEAGAALVRHLGAVGLRPAQLARVLHAAADPAELEAELARANRALLAARSADVRLAARDWLAARGLPTEPEARPKAAP